MKEFYSDGNPNSIKTGRYFLLNMGILTLKLQKLSIDLNLCTGGFDIKKVDSDKFSLLQPGWFVLHVLGIFGTVMLGMALERRT
ncbi:MAG: hypothetical protein Q8912_01600 [Bacillota bacterium]|nr:hypothetical protein [Bacillota bacterium]